MYWYRLKCVVLVDIRVYPRVVLICTAFWTEGGFKSKDYKDTGNNPCQNEVLEFTEDFGVCGVFLGWAILIPFVLFRLCGRMFPVNPTGKSSYRHPDVRKTKPSFLANSHWNDR